MNIRDWLYVRDHCEAIQTVIDKGKLGETYNIGGNNEITNIKIVKNICSILDSVSPIRKMVEVIVNKLLLLMIVLVMILDMLLMQLK